MQGHVDSCSTLHVPRPPTGCSTFRTTLYSSRQPNSLHSCLCKADLLLKSAHDNSAHTFASPPFSAPSNGSTPSSASPPAPVVARLLSFLSVLINSQDGPIAPGQTHASEFAEGNGADVGIQCLEALLRSHQYRRTVWDDELARMGTLPAQGASTNGSEAESGDATPKDAPPPEHAQEQGLIRGLISILRNSVAPGAARGGSGAASPGTGALTPASGSGSGSRTPADKAGPQMQYQVGFCIWLLTFDEQIAAEINL